MKTSLVTLSFPAGRCTCPFSKESNPPCRKGEGFSPVINELYSTQRYLIISSDPSMDTDKRKETLSPHSGFETRFLALLFFGSDDQKIYQAIRKDYPQLKEIFLKYFYWGHYCKCYSGGSPASFCSKLYLEREISPFQPKIIIAIGGKAADFLLGQEKLIDRVNKIWYYRNIPTICTLHSSQDWNRRRGKQFSFYQTWELIRQQIRFDSEDRSKIQKILKEVKEKIDDEGNGYLLSSGRYPN